MCIFVHYTLDELHLCASDPLRNWNDSKFWQKKKKKRKKRKKRIFLSGWKIQQNHLVADQIIEAAEFLRILGIDSNQTDSRQSVKVTIVL